MSTAINRGQLDVSGHTWIRLNAIPDDLGLFPNLGRNYLGKLDHWSGSPKTKWCIVIKSQVIIPYAIVVGWQCWAEMRESHKSRLRSQHQVFRQVMQCWPFTVVTMTFSLIVFFKCQFWVSLLQSWLKPIISTFKVVLFAFFFFNFSPIVTWERRCLGTETRFDWQAWMAGIMGSSSIFVHFSIHKITRPRVMPKQIWMLSG